MTTIIHSNIMRIEIHGSTIRYKSTLRANTQTYEIREVSMIDIARLKAAGPDDTMSASATVEYQTHLYKESHYDSDGKIAKPSRQKPASLKPKTSYR
jgi:hypothetical protein